MTRAEVDINRKIYRWPDAALVARVVSERGLENARERWSYIGGQSLRVLLAQGRREARS